MKARSVWWLLGVTWLLGVSWCGPAVGGIITNGDFQAGLATWTVTSQTGSFGAFDGGEVFNAVQGATPDGTQLPSGNFTVETDPNNYYAVSDQNNPDGTPSAASALWQQFTLPGPVSQATLMFKLFVNDGSGYGAPQGTNLGLDFTTIDSNQHVSVDILKSDANPLSTALDDIVASFDLTENLDLFGVNNQPNAWYPYTLDITNALAAGGTFRLRFAEVNNVSTLNMGIDDVQITTAAAVPEPGSLMLCLSLVGAGAAARWHCRRKERKADQIASVRGDGCLLVARGVAVGPKPDP